LSIKDTPEYKEVAEMLGKYQEQYGTAFYEVARNTDKLTRDSYPFKYRYIWRKRGRAKWHKMSLQFAKEEINRWISTGFKGVELESVKKAERELEKAKVRRLRAEHRAHNARLLAQARATEREAFSFLNWLGRNGQNKKDAPKAWGMIGEDNGN
jgi:hypothetical protein